MTITNYKIDYLNLLVISSIYIFFGNLFRSVSKTGGSLIEYLLVFIILSISILSLSDSVRKQDNKALLFYFFITYLILHSIVALAYRPINLNVSFYEVFYYIFNEFRISTLGYLLPFIFLPLAIKDHEKFIKILIVLAKISIVYTILEQVLSLSGFRSFFEAAYSKSGVVHSYYIDRKSLGMYRIFSLIGVPQLLGVFHIFTLILMLHAKQNYWAGLSFLAVIFSTSKTAYFVFLFLLLVYLLYKKHYLFIIISSLLLFFVANETVKFVEHLKYIYSDDYIILQGFVNSIQGFTLVTTETVNYVTYDSIKDGILTEEKYAVYYSNVGPLSTFMEYFTNEPLQLFFGKGITYSFMPKSLIPSYFEEFIALGSDYYILMFVEQYGLLGFILFTIIFFVYPIYDIFYKKGIFGYILIAFYLSTIHYPPQVSKLMMILVAYAIWQIYLSNSSKYEK